MSERWLVTGAGGFIGRRLVAALQASATPVVGWRRADVDLIDADSVQQAMRAAAPTHIVHLAAGLSAPDHADWRHVVCDALMLSAVVEAMPPSCRLVHAGSMAEFGRAGRFSESAVCRPNSAYGAAKAAASDRALALRHLTGRSICVARLFGVYGPGEPARRLMPHVASALSRSRRVPLSAGDQVRDFVHVDDVCAILIALARADQMPALVNVGTGVGVSVRQVCLSMAAILGASPNLLGFGEIPYRAVDELELVADTSLLTRYVAIPPQRWLNPADLADDIRLAAGAG